MGIDLTFWLKKHWKTWEVVLTRVCIEEDPGSEPAMDIFCDIGRTILNG